METLRVREEYSPVCRAIEKVVDLFSSEDPNWKVYSYSNKKDFEELWSFRDMEADIKRRPTTLIVVWDGMPSREGVKDFVNMSKFITPIDWAVGFSLNLKKGDGNAEDLKIFIVDTCSQLEDDLEGLKLCLKLIPWVWLFQFVSDDTVKDETTFTGSLFDPEFSSMKQIYNSTKKHDIDFAKNLLAARITKPSKPGDHHAIANIIGPQLLLLEESSEVDLHLKALRTLMSEVELLPRRLTEEIGLLSSETAWIDWEMTEWKSSLSALQKENTKINLILLDDMYHLGWGKMLCWAVGVKYIEPTTINPGVLDLISKTEDRINVKAASSPKIIVDKLNELITRGLDNRFNLSFSEEEDSLEVLFLDLRLFSGKPKEELEFFDELLPIAEKFIEDEKNILPWPRFKRKEIERIKNRLEDWKGNPGNQRVEDDDYISALTLLPRVLALVDLSLPIILFSSTGRRDITEKLKNYGNIITDFDKPRYTVDIPNDIANRTKIKFQDAMEKALQILKARYKCKDILSFKDRANNLELKNKGGIHIELFIDESYGNYQSKIYVGGCFAVFAADDVNQARSKADCFNDDLVSNGVCYFNPLNYGAQPPGGKIKAKKNSSVNELNTVMKMASKPDYLAFIRLCNGLQGNKDEYDLLNPNSADNKYRLTLMALIELFLSESLFALNIEESMADDVSISVYAGTRVKYYSDNAEAKKQLNDAKYHFGLGSLSAGKNYFLYSISRESIYPIVTDIISFHNIKRNIDRVIGVKLPYKGEHVEFPEYFICRNCKEIVKIDPYNDIKEERSGFSNYAEVTTIGPGNNYAFIRPIDGRYGNNLYVHKSICPMLTMVSVDDVVIFDDVISTEKGLQARIMIKATEEEIRKFRSAPKKYTLSDSKIKCMCGEKKKFVPEYRALHYIADEILNHMEEVQQNKGYGESIKSIPGGFDDILDQDLERTIRASRHLDQGDIVSAIFEVNDSIAYGNYMATPLLLHRIALRMERLKGEEFCRIAERLTNSFLINKPFLRSAKTPLISAHDKSSKHNYRSVDNKDKAIIETNSKTTGQFTGRVNRPVHGGFIIMLQNNEETFCKTTEILIVGNTVKVRYVLESGKIKKTGSRRSYVEVIE